MQAPKQKTVIIIAGPTAVGKTAVAIAVAKHLQAEIISADSRQCFRELAIGVARPSDDELREVPHHFIASHSITEKVTAATFEQYALAKAAELFEQSEYVVVTGGTGLYLKAFAEGMDNIPEVPPDVHDEILAQYKAQGLRWLQEEIRNRDPRFYCEGEIQNPQRLMRALEVVMATGQSILSYRTGEKKQRDFNVVKIGLALAKETLHANINRRVDGMMHAGLLDEVKSVSEWQHLNALQTVGYKEVFAYLAGACTLADAVENIKRNTRQYAKRQLTWFRRDAGYRWLPPDPDLVIDSIS